jgi:hypothetical protein
MSSPSSALLVHAPGPDRDAIKDRLRAVGLAVRTQDDGRGFGDALLSLSDDVLVIARAADLKPLSAEERSLLDRRWSVVIVGEGAAPPGFRRVVHEPYFIDDLLPPRASATAEAPRAAPETETDVGPLLRGLAHAISNRVQAALGWLSLSEPAIADRSDRRTDAARRARVEVELLGRVAQGLAVLGGRGAPPPTGDAEVAPAIAEEVRKRDVLLRVEGSPRCAVADPEELALVLALLLADHDPDAGPATVTVVSEAGGARISAPSSVAEFIGLGRLVPSFIVARMKRASTLGLALAARLAVRAGGSTAVERGADGSAQVVLRLPARMEREAGA